MSDADGFPLPADMNYDERAALMARCGLRVENAVARSIRQDDRDRVFLVLPPTVIGTAAYEVQATQTRPTWCDEL